MVDHECESNIKPWSVLWMPKQNLWSKQKCVEDLKINSMNPQLTHNPCLQVGKTQIHKTLCPKEWPSMQSKSPK